MCSETGSRVAPSAPPAADHSSANEHHQWRGGAYAVRCVGQSHPKLTRNARKRGKEHAMGLMALRYADQKTDGSVVE
jgi:hypothetical protein